MKTKGKKERENTRVFQSTVKDTSLNHGCEKEQRTIKQITAGPADNLRKHLQQNGATKCHDFKTKTQLSKEKHQIIHLTNVTYLFVSVY